MANGDKQRPRTMIWKGDNDAKPDPFQYYESKKDADGNVIHDNNGWPVPTTTKTTEYTPNPVSPLLYDDMGNKTWTPDSDGWPIDFKYEEDVTCLVHNYDQWGTLCAIYQEYLPTGDTDPDDAEWHKVTGDITEGLQKAKGFSAGHTFRVNYVTSPPSSWFS